jgi:peptide chain release factor subunit 1
MSEVHSGRGLGIYGIFDVVNALKNGIVDLVIVTDDISYVKLGLKCKRCGNLAEKITDRASLIAGKQEMLAKSCPSCGAIDYDLSEVDIVDYLEELSTMTGSKIEVISGRTEEGSQLASLGRMGAILRYKPAS